MKTQVEIGYGRGIVTDDKIINVLTMNRARKSLTLITHCRESRRGDGPCMCEGGGMLTGRELACDWRVAGGGGLMTSRVADRPYLGGLCSVGTPQGD